MNKKTPDMNGPDRHDSGRVALHGESARRIPRVWNYVLIAVLTIALLNLVDRRESSASEKGHAASSNSRFEPEDGLLLTVTGLEVSAERVTLPVSGRLRTVSDSLPANLLIHTRVIDLHGDERVVEIDARLENAEDGFLFWSETYRGDPEEMQEICDTIREALWEGMNVELPTYAEGEKI